LISERRKGDVINYLLHHRYKLNDLPNIKELPAPTRNILKRFGTKHRMMMNNKNLKKKYDIKNSLKIKKEYLNKKTNKYEKLELLEHQQRFFRKFFYQMFQVVLFSMAQVQEKPSPQP
jgi:hypothetical protein